MARVRFTANIQRHVTCPDATIDGSTARQVLDGYFAAHPDARGYVLEDQGGLRKHMNLFVDGRAVADRVTLGDPVGPESTVDVFQALSGG